MKPSDFEIHDRQKLDNILTELCQMVIDGQQTDSEYYGMVAAAVLDIDNRLVKALNYVVGDGKHKHAERAAIDKYNSEYGDIPEGSIIITTLSPCSEHMDERYGEDCTDLINDTVVRKVYCGYEDPTQDNSKTYQHKKFHVEVTKNTKIKSLCKKFADTFLKDDLTEVNPNTLQGSEGPGLNECRQYLLDKLKEITTDFDTIYILGSWYGNLSMMIEKDNDINFDRIINVETDKEALETGQEVINKLGYQFIEPMLKDANELDYRQLGKKGLVINQSCTNIEGNDWFTNIPKGTIVALTARNNDDKATNQFNSVYDLVERYPLDNILYAGKSNFEDPETPYDCYLVIGTK